MSTAAAALIVLAVLLVGVPALYVQIRRAAAHESTKARIVRETHERARAAALSDPVTLTAADEVASDIGGHLVGYLLDNPQLAAGFERLDRAMREQQKGEQL
jgi:hypothetical protein